MDVGARRPILSLGIFRLENAALGTGPQGLVKIRTPTNPDPDQDQCAEGQEHERIGDLMSFVFPNL